MYTPLNFLDLKRASLKKHINFLKARLLELVTGFSVKNPEGNSWNLVGKNGHKSNQIVYWHKNSSSKSKTKTLVSISAFRNKYWPNPYQYCTSMRIYSTLTHINNVSGKVAAIKRRDMMTNSQPKHPSLPELLSVERVKNTLQACTGVQSGAVFAHVAPLFHTCEHLNSDRGSFCSHNYTVKWSSGTALFNKGDTKHSGDQAARRTGSTRLICPWWCN